MRVSEEDGVNALDLVLERLVPQVRTSVDEDNPTVIQGKAGGGAISVIFWVARGAHLTHAPGEGNSS